MLLISFMDDLCSYDLVDIFFGLSNVSNVELFDF